MGLDYEPIDMKRILVANFFPAFTPPSSGGEQRYYYLYFYLSAHFDITLLSPTYSNHEYELVEHSPTFREHRVPKDTIFDQLHWELHKKEIGPECSALVVALAAGHDTKYQHHFEKLVCNADLVVHESPFTLPFDKTLSTDGKPRIYNSYNVEFKLAKQIFQGELIKSASDFIRFLEHDLVTSAALVLATCEEEAQEFVTEFHLDPSKIGLAPNGFEPPAPSQSTTAAPELGKKTFAIFMGSAHPPNIDAARFIVDVLAPRLKHIDFRLLGSVGKSFLSERLPQNVEVLGFVSEAEKAQLLQSCALALNPMFAGAGTNLKMLDYMAAGAPIVTTAVGARGLALQNGVEAVVAEPENFIDVIEQLVAAPKRAEQMGKRAQDLAYRCYTWRTIAESVAASIARVFEKHDTEKQKLEALPTLLIVNDFPVAHATGGGQVRIKELMTELGACYRVILLCLGGQADKTKVWIASNVLEICVPKTLAHQLAEKKKNAQAPVSVSDIVAADYCLANSVFVKLFERYAAIAEAVIFEHPYLAPLLTLLPQGKPVVYSSLNCEMQLKAELLGRRPDAEKLICQVTELETKLLQAADLVVCVSESDRRLFSARFPDKRYLVVENGVRCNHYSGYTTRLLNDPLLNPSGKPVAMFVGSAHMPNVEAANYILNVLAPRLPAVVFGIIGSACGAIRHRQLPGNVILFGVLEEEEKNCLLKNATVAINPLFAGGGSSLKVPDFFAAELPVVSTKIGVRGYGLVDGVHFLSADAESFPNCLNRLLGDESLRSSLRKNALAFAKANVDWPVLGKRYLSALRGLTRRSQRLLVVTYRFTDLPLGGAEAYLNNLLGELAKISAFSIDVATYDVGRIANKWHFSAEYGPTDSTTRNPDYLENLFRFPLDAANSNANFNSCKKLFSMWMKESRVQGREFLDIFETPILLGGWNFPEKKIDGTYARWSSKNAEIYLGHGAKNLTMTGFIPSEGVLTLFVSGEKLGQSYKGAFDLNIPLAMRGDQIVKVVVEGAPDIENDPRELGARFHRIALEDANGWKEVSLGDDYASHALARDADRWVRSLILLTQKRAPEEDDLFVAVRGPHSSALNAWLEENIARYDVVLAQGVPFASSVNALEISKRCRVPCVLLPHFHMEDKYYHWQSFYRAFREADLVLASPRSAAHSFFEPLGARSHNVLGGGANGAEFLPVALDKASEAFRKVHTAIKPFMLVLGRKAGGKNYRMVIEALGQLNRQGHRLDLVMIGPDDDGVRIDESNAYYYGMQAREVVVGALASCLCVVNMSGSESFGIVLIESWLAGRPVIAQRNCAAFAELVKDGETGFLVETAQEIADAVLSYLKDEDMAFKLGEAGKKFAQAFTWNALAEDVNACLLDVVCRPA